MQILQNVWLMAHQFDALVMVPNCDKNVPGSVNGCSKSKCPNCICFSGGPMLAGHVEGHETSLSSMFEAVGANAAGKMSLKKM